VTNSSDLVHLLAPTGAMPTDNSAAADQSHHDHITWLVPPRKPRLPLCFRRSS
jgi:hypothetical protein